jgi:hypothetical protein
MDQAHLLDYELTSPSADMVNEFPMARTPAVTIKIKSRSASIEAVLNFGFSDFVQNCGWRRSAKRSDAASVGARELAKLT